MDQTIEQKLEELNREFDRKRCELAREYVARLAALGLTTKDHVIVPVALPMVRATATTASASWAKG